LNLRKSLLRTVLDPVLKCSIARIYLTSNGGKIYFLRIDAFARDDTIYNKILMAILIITLSIILFLGFTIMLHQVLKSKDDVDLTVNLKKGEMNLKKKKNQ
jgi:hypothetical protein